jgi:hypothetical protein
MEEQVVLVFVDRRRMRCTADTARRLCADPMTAGRIVDALTENEALQSFLRNLMDNAGGK